MNIYERRINLNVPLEKLSKKVKQSKEQQITR